MQKNSINIALICSKGGHFEQMTNLSEFYNAYNHFWITIRNNQTASALSNEKKHFVELAHFRRPWTYLQQLPHFIRIFLREKPTHIISTGSGMTAFLPFILSKLLKIRFIYIDTFSRVKGYSKLGAFILRTGHPIFSQWEDLENPNVTYIGPIFKTPLPFQKNSDSNYIFVTVGTREEPFGRLLQIIEELKIDGIIKENITVQAGNTNYNSDVMEIFDFCSPTMIEELIRDAKYVVTQESAGIGTLCLKYETKFIVMPRDYSYGELYEKSDMNEDLHFKLEEMGFTKVVNNKEELRNAIVEVDGIKTGFEFDNSLAIKTLTQCMEGTA